jgi:hypothetical protein
MPQIDDVFALPRLLLVDAARIWISGTAERNYDRCDSDIICPGGNISLFAGNQLSSLFSAVITVALYACPQSVLTCNLRSC